MPLRPPATIGAPIDEALRVSIIDWFARAELTVDGIWSAYLQNFACTDVHDLLSRLERRYSQELAQRFRADLDSTLREWVKFGIPSRANPKSPAVWAMPRCALQTLPDVEFLMAVQEAISLRSGPRGVSTSDSPAATYINRVFETVGVSYRYGYVPGFEHLEDWERPVEFYRLLDPQLEERLIQPALRVLADPRLATASENFGDGLRRVAKADASELDDAVRDFGRSVQETLFVLATLTCGEPKRGMAGALFGQLKKASILPAESEWMVLGIAHFRNEEEHPRGVVRATDHRTAEAAMGTAATAITYLASFLPGRGTDVPIDTRDFAAASAPADDDLPF